jgi:hypothetical protein
MKPCCQNILFPTKWPRKHFSSSWRGKDVAVLHYSYGEFRVEKVRVEDRADCSSWRKVWRRYVDLIIFTFFSDFFRRASTAAMSGIMIRHYCCGSSLSSCLTFFEVDTWYSVLKKIAFCITVSQVVSSSSIFYLSVLFSSSLFLESRFVQKQNDLCKKCFLLQRARLAVTRWCLLWWASRDPRDFTRKENAKFFVFFLLDDTKCGYKTCC